MANGHQDFYFVSKKIGQPRRGNYRTPRLFRAVLNRNERMLKLLLKEGGLKTERDDAPALHWASAFNRGNSHGAIIRNLLEFGSNVNEKNATKDTILDLLMLKGEIATCRMVIEYVAKIEAKTNKQVFDEHNLALISNNPEMKSHYEKCRAELTGMKNRKIGDTLITCLSVLTKPVEVVARYARNEDFLNDFKADDYETAYPTYTSQLKRKFDEATARQKMIEQVCTILSATLKFADPSHVAFEIIAQYFNESDIKILIDSSNQV